jgi:hypothetical protein
VTVCFAVIVLGFNWFFFHLSSPSSGFFGCLYDFL